MSTNPKASTHLADTHNDSTVVLTIDPITGQPKRKRKLCRLRRLSPAMANAFIFFHFMTCSVFWGYSFACKLQVQARGATLTDQSRLTMSDYPLSFIFLVTPFFDKYYSRRIGRSRTYVIPVTLFLSLFCFLVSSQMYNLVHEKDISALLVNFIVCSIGMAVLNVTGESWILTLYDNDDHRSQAANYMYMGQNLGYFIGYNVFIPLNDLDWLNRHIFHGSLKEPILGHHTICYIAGLLYGIEFFLVTFIIGERKIKHEAPEGHNLFDMYKLLPKHFVNRHMRNFIFYTFATSMVYYSVYYSLDYLLVSNKKIEMSTSTITNIDTIAYPFVTTAAFMVTRLMKKGNLVRMYHLNSLVNLFVGIFRFLNYLDLINNRNIERTIIGRSFISFFIGCDFTGTFAFGFFNLIVDERFGNTGLSCLASIRSQSIVLSSTLGFFIMSKVGRDNYIPVAFCLQAISLLILYPYARKLDRKNPSLFDLRIDMSIKDLFVHEFEMDEERISLTHGDRGKEESEASIAPPSTPLERSFIGGDNKKGY